jgi:hypothetical protein
MRLWIPWILLLALAACAGSQQGSSYERALSFTGVAPSAPVENDENACPDAAFPGGASLDSSRDGAMTFFCEH